MDYNNLSSVLRLGRIGSIDRLRPSFLGARFLAGTKKILSRNARSSRLIFKEPLFEAS